jgi:hypothetical protein
MFVPSIALMRASSGVVTRPRVNAPYSAICWYPNITNPSPQLLSHALTPPLQNSPKKKDP